MNPIFCHVGGKAIYWYGVFMALAFLAGMVNWSLLGRREGRTWAFASDLGFWIMLSGIVGARVAYVAANLDYYMAQPAEIVRVDRGGLVFYGGFVGAGLGIAVFARLHRERLLGLMDFIITAIPLGHALGRIGCYLNGCCYGQPWEGWGAVLVDGANRYPVQLYEAVANLLIYLLVLARYRLRVREGDALCLYLFVYPVSRFLLEFLRGDGELQWMNLTVAQWASIVLFAIGLVLRFSPRPRHEPANG